MFRKIASIVLITFVVGVHSGAIIAPSATLVSARNELAEDSDPTDSNPNYHFEYAVNDATTGDHKSQFETRNGDVVNGRYTVLEPTGETRQVDYTADAFNGFNAVVTRHSAAKIIAQPAIVAPTKLIAQPTYVAAPAKIISQPIIAAAPAKIISTPVATKYISTPVATAKYISQPIISHAPASYIAQPFARYAYSAPIVSHAPYYAQYHAPTAAIVSHSPLTYHAPAAAIIHH